MVPTGTRFCLLPNGGVAVGAGVFVGSGVGVIVGVGLGMEVAVGEDVGVDVGVGVGGHLKFSSSDGVAASQPTKNKSRAKSTNALVAKRETPPNSKLLLAEQCHVEEVKSLFLISSNRCLRSSALRGVFTSKQQGCQGRYSPC